MSASAQPSCAPTSTSLEAVISDGTLKTVLTPYKLHCRYLQSANVEKGSNGAWLLKARGRFSIPESCYIADTGHFNAVEFNICYNQLTYCLLAQAIDYQLLDVVRMWSLSEFSRRQLSDFLIVNFNSTFRKPLNARQFEGWVAINKVTVRQRNIFMKTSCGFEDSSGASSHGGAVIVILSGQEEHVQ